VVQKSFTMQETGRKRGANENEDSFQTGWKKAKSPIESQKPEYLNIEGVDQYIKYS
jgi:hypothetical protein